MITRGNIEIVAQIVDTDFLTALLVAGSLYMPFLLKKKRGDASDVLTPSCQLL